MPVAKIISNEKAMNLETQNKYVLVFDDMNFSINKIELSKLLKKEGYNPINIKVVNLPSKVKMKGAKRRKTTQKRAKKFYVTLEKGQKLDEKFELKVAK